MSEENKPGFFRSALNGVMGALKGGVVGSIVGGVLGGIGGAIVGAFPPISVVTGTVGALAGVITGGSVGIVYGGVKGLNYKPPVKHEEGPSKEEIATMAFQQGLYVGQQLEEAKALPNKPWQQRVGKTTQAENMAQNILDQRALTNTHKTI